MIDSKKILSLIELPVRVLGPFSSARYSNVERIKQFDFSRPRVVRKSGISAMLRAKNEESIIEQCVLSIVECFDEIIFIDNGSSDNTLEIVSKLAKIYGNIKVHSYPHLLSRCGNDHRSTDPNSVKSLVYYYNWCASLCSFGYIMKWDADMILDGESKGRLMVELAKLSTYWPTYLELEIQTVYIKGEKYYLSDGEINKEVMVFPNRSDVRYVKADDFELLEGKKYSSRCIHNADVMVYEVKDTGKNEFSHWDTLEFKTERKKMEFERFNELVGGKLENFSELPSPCAKA